MKITRLTAAALALLMLTACGGSPEPLPPEPSPEESVYHPNLPEQSPGEVKLSVTSGEKTVHPLELFEFSATWHSDDRWEGWVAADGFYRVYNTDELFLGEYGDKIPTVTLCEVISVSKNLGFSFKISKDLPKDRDPSIRWESDRDFTYERLSTEEPGVYYVMFLVDYRWDYVPEGNDYNTARYSYLFKLQVDDPACADPGPNVPEQKHGEVKLSVTSGGETIYPLEFFCWSTTWNSNNGRDGWLCTDGHYDYDHTLEQYGDTVPTITLCKDISVSKNLGFTFKIGKEVPTAGGYIESPESEENFTYERLNKEEPGVYYVMFLVDYRWDYVPEGKDYNKARYSYLFKLQIDGPAAKA